MHEKEWRRQKCATGRLACLNLAGSEIIPGLAFDDEPRLRNLLDDPGNCCVLLYPGDGAINLSIDPFPAQSLGLIPPGGAVRSPSDAGRLVKACTSLAETIDRSLVVLIIDATWSCSRAVLRANPGLMTLPRVMFTPRQRSRWIIKKQPADWCLSTIEAIHELLLVLETAGLDCYPDKTRLLDVFMAMQEYQVRRETAGRNPRHRLGQSRASLEPIIAGHNISPQSSSTVGRTRPCHGVSP
jgi:DTW domain-containing protein YfiP